MEIVKEILKEIIIIQRKTTQDKIINLEKLTLTRDLSYFYFIYYFLLNYSLGFRFKF